ncbi:chloride channel protein [bacterium]|nr:chloride channel protein [bacterium]
MKIDISHFNKNKNLNERIYITFLAIIIGALTGFGAVGVHHIIIFFQNLFFGKGKPIELFTNASIWQLLLIPLLIGAVVGFIVQFVAPETKGSGVPDVMASVMMRGGKIRLRVAFSKTLSCALSIGSGASIGSEGPQAQIGASLSSNIARFFLKKEDYIKLLVAAGAGSGIAAAFNAPMAGALFAAEVILGDFSITTFSPIIVATVSSTLVSHHFLGNRVILSFTEYHISSADHFFLFAGMGVGAGFLSLLFIWVLYYSEYLFDKILKIPLFLKTAIGGFFVGLIGIFYPQIMGVGFDVINVTLQENSLYWILIIIVFLKIIATSITLGSGHSGGVFAPSLLIGVTFGLFVGKTAALLGHNSIPLSLWAVLGMTGVLSGATQAPIASMFIIFEMSQNYTLIAPLIITSITASLITTFIKKESIYTQKLALNGIYLHKNRKDNPLKNREITTIVKNSNQFITKSTSIKTIIRIFINSNFEILPIIESDSNRTFCGIVSLKSLKWILEESSEILNEILNAIDVMESSTILQSDFNWMDALEVFANSEYRELPVCDSNNIYIGMVKEEEIFNLYNVELQKNLLANMIGGDEIITKRKIPFSDGYWIELLDESKEFFNQVIAEMNFFQKYSLEIILIYNSIDNIKSIPTGKYRLKKGDQLIILGKESDISRFKNKKGA